MNAIFSKHLEQKNIKELIDSETVVQISSKIDITQKYF